MNSRLFQCMPFTELKKVLNEFIMGKRDVTNLSPYDVSSWPTFPDYPSLHIYVCTMPHVNLMYVHPLQPLRFCIKRGRYLMYSLSCP